MSFDLEAARRKADRYSVSLTRDDLIAACDEIERLTRQIESLKRFECCKAADRCYVAEKERDAALAQVDQLQGHVDAAVDDYNQALALLREAEPYLKECGWYGWCERLAALLKEHK